MRVTTYTNKEATERRGEEREELSDDGGKTIATNNGLLYCTAYINHFVVSGWLNLLFLVGFGPIGDARYSWVRYFVIYIKYMYVGGAQTPILVHATSKVTFTWCCSIDGNNIVVWIIEICICKHRVYNLFWFFWVCIITAVVDFIKGFCKIKMKYLISCIWLIQQLHHHFQLFPEQQNEETSQ